MWYKIIPNDTLFFRDGKPFTMGADTWADTLFPPYPSTLYGAIRSWLIFEKGNLKDFNNGKLKAELGTHSEKGTLGIKGPFLIKDELYFPTPKDFVYPKSNETYLYKLSLIKRPEFVISDYRLEKLFVWQRNELVDDANYFVSSVYFKDYLTNCSKIKFIEKSQLFSSENKTGIARERLLLTTKKSHLYRIPMVRLQKDVSLVLKIEGVVDLPESGVIQLGGEGKSAKIELLQEDILGDLLNINLQNNGKIFKIYFATPTIFEKGWLPKWIDTDTLKGNYNGIQLKLISACIGNHKFIGGWDVKFNKPKPMRKSVPAGSVYYFEILDDSDQEKIKQAFHFKNISDINSDEGFGLTFVGSV
ncbi:MAG: type III-B CRISPR module-associated protein Cmr3 [Ignavibacteria bacterium]|nr:type III-B CRISPR module-associated protein Cmr3 [Ignavibacteria bacterium]